MAAETVAIQVPQALSLRLERLAASTRQPLERLVAQALSSSIPPLPDDLPEAAHDALLALEGLGDDDLWHTFRAHFPDGSYKRLSRLGEKQRHGPLTEAEHATLDALRQEADLVTLRKAYAGVLLKWRGHRLPTPT